MYALQYSYLTTTDSTFSTFQFAFISLLSFLFLLFPRFINENNFSKS